MSFFKTFYEFVHYKLTHASEERWRVLAICVMLSGGILFLQKMGKSYTTGMKVRLTVEYDPALYRPAEPLPKALWVNVTAQGWPLALAAYSPNRPRLVIKPAMTNGFWTMNPIEARNQLQASLDRVQINYVTEPIRPYRFEAIKN